MFWSLLTILGDVWRISRRGEKGRVIPLSSSSSSLSFWLSVFFPVFLSSSLLKQLLFSFLSLCLSLYLSSSFWLCLMRLWLFLSISFSSVRSSVSLGPRSLASKAHPTSPAHNLPPVRFMTILFSRKTAKYWPTFWESLSHLAKDFQEGFARKELAWKCLKSSQFLFPIFRSCCSSCQAPWHFWIGSYV